VSPHTTELYNNHPLIQDDSGELVTEKTFIHTPLPLWLSSSNFIHCQKSVSSALCSCQVYIFFYLTPSFLWPIYTRCPNKNAPPQCFVITITTWSLRPKFDEVTRQTVLCECTMFADNVFIYSFSACLLETSVYYFSEIKICILMFWKRKNGCKKWCHCDGYCDVHFVTEKLYLLCHFCLINFNWKLLSASSMGKISCHTRLVARELWQLNCKEHMTTKLARC